MSTQQSRNTFTEELCKYFMDFLQSGFKSTRFPKRYIRPTDEKGFKIGINLSKYENFNESIRKILNKPEPFQQDISVKKGTHTVKLNDNSIDLLKKLTKQIKDKDIDKIVLLSSKTIKEFAISHRNKPDEAYEKINDGRKDLTNRCESLGYTHDGEKDARRGATEKAEVLSEQQTRQTQVCEGALLC